MTIRKLLSKLFVFAGLAIYALLLLMLIFLFLIEQGWQRPFQSLKAKSEMQAYLTETYTEPDLHTTFPVYNMIGDEFISFVKDGDGQVLFGLVYREDSGITEHEAFQAKGGSWAVN